MEFFHGLSVFANGPVGNRLIVDRLIADGLVADDGVQFSLGTLLLYVLGALALILVCMLGPISRMYEHRAEQRRERAESDAKAAEVKAVDAKVVDAKTAESKAGEVPPEAGGMLRDLDDRN